MTPAPRAPRRVVPYLWDRGKPTETPGVMITTEKQQFFVALADAYNLADRIVSAAEQMEAQE